MSFEWVDVNQLGFSPKVFVPWSASVIGRKERSFERFLFFCPSEIFLSSQQDSQTNYLLGTKPSHQSLKENPHGPKKAFVNKTTVAKEKQASAPKTEPPVQIGHQKTQKAQTKPP